MKLFRSVLCVGVLFGAALAQAEHRDGRGDRDGRDGGRHHEGGDWRGGIRSRIRSAHEEIERGKARGSLTHKESLRLKRELDNILVMIDAMKDDGRLSPHERDRINGSLDRLDRDIRREKRDDDRRGDGRRDHGRDR